MLISREQYRELIDLYPSIYQPMRLQADRQLIHVCAGWLPLLYAMSDLLLDEIALGATPGVHIRKIARRFGGVMIDADGARGIGARIMRAARWQSYHVCELCGRPGRLVYDCFYETTCPMHTPPSAEPVGGEVLDRMANWHRYSTQGHVFKGEGDGYER